MGALATDDVDVLRRALAKYLKVDDMPKLTDEDLERLHDDYMEEMTGTTPLPHDNFNPMFKLWTRLARHCRYIGFRNVKEHYLSVRYPDIVPTVLSTAMNIKMDATSISHSIPTLPAMLAMLDTRSKIAEVGAGSGYLASQLADLGADIVCCDVDVKKDTTFFHKIEEMDGREFIRKHNGFPDRALLICWGYYKNGIPRKYEQMIKLFKGDFLYVIGEQRSDLCTFCLAMCKDNVQDQWKKIGVYDLPAFEDYRLYNQLVIYKRIGVTIEDLPKLQMRPQTRRNLEYL